MSKTVAMQLGVDTNKHTPVTVSFNDIELKQMHRVMEHYDIKTQSELMRVLVKRAALHIDTGK